MRKLMLMVAALVLVVVGVVGQAPAPTAQAQGTGAGARTGQILLTSNRESWDDCYIANADGSNLRRLTTFGFCYDAHFTPNGQQIYFAHAESGGLFDLYRMNVDGSGITNLTNTTDNAERWPAVSPDGTSVAYLFAWPGGFEIYTMNMDGTNRRPVTSRNLDLQPSWSPDSQWIAFASFRDGNSFNIHLVRRDGSGLTKLTNFGADRLALSPVFSPDGQQVAFASIGVGTEFEVWAINVDGSNLRKIADTGGTDITNFNYVAAWRGDTILYNGYDGDWDPYFVSATGGAATMVAASPRDDDPTDWFTGAAAPPAQPTAAPAQPTAAPAQPTAAPAQPTAAPAQPTAAPAQPTAAPATPAVKPVITAPGTNFNCYLEPTNCNFSWTYGGTLAPNQYFQVQAFVLNSNQAGRGLHAPTKSMSVALNGNTTFELLRDICNAELFCGVNIRVAVVEWDGTDPSRIGAVVALSDPIYVEF